jgi:hypothetical protein
MELKQLGLGSSIEMSAHNIISGVGACIAS